MNSNDNENNTARHNLIEEEYSSEEEGEDDDDVGRDEDMDAFLVKIESKLRLNFTSLDLSRAIQNEAGGTGTRRQLRLLARSFEKMTVPVKLRVTISMLCLDPHRFSSRDEAAVEDVVEAQKIESAVCDVIRTAQRDDDEWVSTLASVVESRMYGLSSSEKTGLVKTLEEASLGVLNEMASASANSNRQTNDDNDINIMAPLYAPNRLDLLSSKDLNNIFPECIPNRHFGIPAGTIPDALRVDDIREKEKAEEETKQIERREQRLREAALQSESPQAHQQKLPTQRPAIQQRRPTGRNMGRGGSKPSSSFMRAPQRPGQVMMGRSSAARRGNKLKMMNPDAAASEDHLSGEEQRDAKRRRIAEMSGIKRGQGRNNNAAGGLRGMMMNSQRQSSKSTGNDSRFSSICKK